MSTSKSKSEPSNSVVVLGGDTVLAIVRSARRNQEFRVKSDYYWTTESDGSERGKLVQTDEECILLRVGNRGGCRIPKTLSAIDTVLEACERAKEVFFG